MKSIALKVGKPFFTSTQRLNAFQPVLLTCQKKKQLSIAALRSPMNHSLFRKTSYSQICYTKLFYSYSSTFQMLKSMPLKPKLPVHQFLDAHLLQYTQGPNVYKVKYCPFCPKPHHDEPSNLHVLQVHKEYGYYHCFRCSAKGNWLDFREKILGLDSDFSVGSFFSDNKESQPQSKTVQPRISDSQFYFYKQNLTLPDYSDVFEYVKSRGFKEETIQAFNLGAGTQEFFDQDGEAHKIKLVYFPLYRVKEGQERKISLMEAIEQDKNNNFTYKNNWTQIAKVKMRGASRETKKYMRQYPIGSQKGLFGLNLVKDTDKTIVVTEGQFDAMAVYQESSFPAVSLPQGATNLPDNLLPYFQRFDKIILWMDNDEAGLLNTSKIAEKLGLKRTYIVKHTVAKMKDANDFLMKSPAMISELLHKASTIPDSSIINFFKLREVIKAKLLNNELDRGLKVSWLPFFNQKVKGVRLGQLTIISGPTGSGKTTFLSQLFLDLCQRDVGVLWGSFQIRNQVLVTHMITQFSNTNLAKNIEKFDYYASKFEKLPLFLMNFFGSTQIEKILSTMVYSIQKYNVHMIVIDTLQFLLSEQAEGFKKFELQDTLMAKLRQISIKYNVHIAIVIHPRKTEDNEDIGIHSIYGTSKATQEADNIWVIQNRDGFKLLDVKKNRYDGELGKIPLGFNKDTKKFFQLRRAEFEALRTKEKTMKQIIREREEEQAKQNPISEQEKHLFDEQIHDHELRKEQKPSYNPYK